MTKNNTAQSQLDKEPYFSKLTPNKKTIAAMRAAHQGKVKSAKNIKTLIKDLNK